MNNNAEIEHRFSTEDIFFLKIDGDGYHYDLIIVSDIFLNQSKINRQKWVYNKLQDLIISGKLHAINMQTLTKAEWEQING